MIPTPLRRAPLPSRILLPLLSRVVLGVGKSSYGAAWSHSEGALPQEPTHQRAITYRFEHITAQRYPNDGGAAGYRNDYLVRIKSITVFISRHLALLCPIVIILNGASTPIWTETRGRN